jgi:hypothetical protein
MRAVAFQVEIFGRLLSTCHRASMRLGSSAIPHDSADTAAAQIIKFLRRETAPSYGV